MGVIRLFEKFTSMDTKAQISLLKEQRLRAIDACEFQKLRTIDTYIAKLEEDLKTRHQVKESEQVRSSFELKREQIRKSAAEALNTSQMRVYEIIEGHHRRLVEIERKHCTDLQRNAEDRARDLEFATIRGVPEADQLKKQAKSESSRTNYDIAEELLQQSEEVRNATIVARQNEVGRKFDKLRDTIDLQYESDLKISDDALQAQLKEVSIEYDRTVERLKLRLSAAMQKHGVNQSAVELVEFKELDFNQPKTPPSSPISARKSRTTPIGSPRSTTRLSASTPRRSPRPQSGSTTPNRPSKSMFL